MKIKINKIKTKKDTWMEIKVKEINMSICFENFPETNYIIKIDDSEINVKSKSARISSKNKEKIYVKSDKDSEIMISLLKRSMVERLNNV